jgi:hypothetical protein
MRGLLVLVAATVAACGAEPLTPSQRCEAAWTRLQRSSPTEHTRFMAMCIELPASTVECMATRRTASEACREVLIALPDWEDPPPPPPPMPLQWVRREMVFTAAAARFPADWERVFDDEYGTPHDHEANPSRMKITHAPMAGPPRAAADWWPYLLAEETWRFPSAGGLFETRIVRDEPLPDGHLFVAEQQLTGSWLLDVFRWGDGGEVAVHCHVELSPRLAPQLAEFEAACRDLEVSSFTPRL